LPIRVLPPEVASAIAAGEVIERPASVVKELVENAIDAEAKSVRIRTANAGIQLVEVEDDGIGIPAREIQLTVERHATSKLAKSEDLYDIRSLGFRGEALASIASVSRFQLTSKTDEDEIGARLRVEAGGPAQIEAIGAPTGTSVVVRDLFYNLPARRQFLKSKVTERRHIKDWVTRYALAYPDIQFSLHEESRPLFESSGQGGRREVLAELLGVERAREMIALPDFSTFELDVSGYISPPSITRSNRGQLTFFVNGRWIQDGALTAAVVQAYQGLLMVGRYPFAVLFVNLPPEAVDVNVHPAKAEVRFRDPRSAFSTVQRAVRATLLRETPPPSFQLESRWGAGEGDRSLGPTSASLWQVGQSSVGPPAIQGEQMIQAPLRGKTSVPLLRAVGQVGSAYLVAEGPDGIYLIDQHAAHERVLYERFMRGLREGRLESQALLEAASVELEGYQTGLLEDRLDLINRLGFEIESFGPKTYRVRAIPALLGAISPEMALRSLIENLEEDEEPLKSELEALIAARVCKRAAIKAGQVLSLEEQRTLVRDLESCGSPRTCPHGRPTLIHLSVDSLERQFGRKG
jgi:DNA mismatch repair protein MutL